jgi:hypothetical protein
MRRRVAGFVVVVVVVVGDDGVVVVAVVVVVAEGGGPVPVEASRVGVVLAAVVQRMPPISNGPNPYRIHSADHS